MPAIAPPLSPEADCAAALVVEDGVDVWPVILAPADVDDDDDDGDDNVDVVVDEVDEVRVAVDEVADVAVELELTPHVTGL
jgi:hypothetical protein